VEDGPRFPGEDRRGPESFKDQVNAKRRLPSDLRECRDDLPRRACLEDAEHDGDPRSADQRTSDEPQHGHPPWHQAGSVHQVAEQESVPDADNEAGSEQRRPIIDRDQRPTGDVE
jgi:hypothetical protein